MPICDSFWFVSIWFWLGMEGQTSSTSFSYIFVSITIYLFIYGLKETHAYIQPIIHILLHKEWKLSKSLSLTYFIWKLHWQIERAISIVMILSIFERSTTYQIWWVAFAPLVLSIPLGMRILLYLQMKPPVSSQIYPFQIKLWSRLFLYLPCLKHAYLIQVSFFFG